jgi:hypothetical protein
MDSVIAALFLRRDRRFGQCSRRSRNNPMSKGTVSGDWMHTSWVALMQLHLAVPRRAHIWYAVPWLILVLQACHPSPGPTEGTNPTCSLSESQSGEDLRINCRLTGSLQNTRFDLFVPGSNCGINSFSLFNQTINTPILLIWGQNGDDTDARVRIGGSIGPGRHTGSIAKDGPGCESIVEPTVAVDTGFRGQYVALVDKSQSPKCVFESRLVLDQFTQNVGGGLSVDVGGLTRPNTEETLLRRMDLEVATAVTGLLGSLPLSNAAVQRSGRCPNNDWQPFTG